VGRFSEDVTDMPMKRIRRLYKDFKDKHVITLAASVSFFGFLSLFPFLILLASIASFFFEKAQVLVQVERLLRPFPPGVAQTVLKTLTGALNSGRVASALSFLVLIYSSSAVFGQLETALHAVMGTKSRIKGWRATLRTFAFFLATALVLLLLMVGGSALFVVASKLAELPVVRAYWVIEAGTFLVMTGLFALSFRALAFKKPAWANALRGGLFTAAAWEILKILFGWYIRSITSFTALYGVIGSVFFLMLWLFYSVVLYLFGAHISVEWE
jgi:membrane protein